MLTVAELQQHLTRISYRPGWAFEVREGRWEGHHIVVHAKVEDAYHPGEFVPLDIHSALPRMDSLGQFENWLADRLARIEVHEMREWLRRDGTAIFDPHADGADRDL